MFPILVLARISYFFLRKAHVKEGALVEADADATLPRLSEVPISLFDQSM